MSENSKASSPFVSKASSKKPLASYIPLELPKWPSKTASEHTSKFARSWESRTGPSKKKLNDSAKTETSDGCRQVTPIKKNDWNKIGIIRLHEEIKAFYEAVLPQPKDQLDREEVVKRITAAVKSLWSGARVEVFGSFRTGLFLPASDIDLVVFGCWKIKPLYTLRDELVRRGVCEEGRTTVLDKASVPIIKITDKMTGIKVDISFNVTNGLTSAELIQCFLQEFPSLPYLVLVLKQFVYQRDLNEVYTGGIGSYSLILLAVSFLQLQTRAEGRMANVNYGVQLLEFFELYGMNFNYSRAGISVVDGGKYVQKERDSQGQMSLYIQDPACEGNDVARGTYNLYQVQMAFSHAYHTLCNEVLRARDDVFSKQRPILSSIIDFECNVEIPSDLFLDSTNGSSQSATIKKHSSTNSEIKTPIRILEQSFNKDSSTKSEKKRRHNHSTDFEKNKKKKHRDFRSLSLLTSETS